MDSHRRSAIALVAAITPASWPNHANDAESYCIFQRAVGFGCRAHVVGCRDLDKSDHCKDFLIPFLINRENKIKQINPPIAVIMNISRMLVRSAINPSIAPAAITPASKAP